MHYLHRRLTGLWHHADFMRLWTGQTISLLGSMIGGTAMSFTAILFLQATPFQLGLLSAAQLLPGFLTGLIAGAWVDRLRRRPILIAVDLGRAALLATIPLAAVLGVLRIEQLYAVTFLVSILTLLFDVAYQSYLPSLVGRDELIEGNSKLEASASVAEVSGFSVAGWLVQIFTAPLTILIDAVSFIVSAISVWRIRTPEPAVKQSGDIQPNLRREILEGLSALLRQPLLRVIAACSFSQEFFSGIYGALVVLYMVREVGFEPGVLGVIWAVGGVSSLLGAVVAEPVTRRLGIGPAMIIGLLLASLFSFFIPLAQGATLVAAGLLIAAQLGDGAATLSRINQVSLRQALAPESLLGRINASARFIGLGATLAGSLVGGALGEWIGVRPTLFLAVIGSLLSILWLVFSPVRALHAAPEPDASSQ